MAACDPQLSVVSELIFVGAGLPANTGEARASLRVACFAGEPAPTGFAPVSEKEHWQCFRNGS